MSMSCLPISASSKSSGTSYTSNTPTATGKSLSSFFLAASFDFESVEPVTITGETAALPETIFASSVISTYLVILSEAKDYALARVATTTFPAPRIPATSPSMRAHPSSFHPRPCAPAPSQLPEYPTPAWDSPQISCAAPAWDSARATGNRRPNPCTRCTRCPPTDSPHLLLLSSLCG